MADKIDKWNHEDYEPIDCRECGEYKPVEKGTWAIENGMCERCWCEYNGG